MKDVISTTAARPSIDGVPTWGGAFEQAPRQHGSGICDPQVTV